MRELPRIGKPLMPSIRVKENESFDAALRRFRRACEKSGVLAEVRKREFYEKPTEVRKRKAMAAQKRNRKRQAMVRIQRSRLH